VILLAVSPTTAEPAPDADLNSLVNQEHESDIDSLASSAFTKSTPMRASNAKGRGGKR
jgi:hypothetical protein